MKLTMKFAGLLVVALLTVFIAAPWGDVCHAADKKVVVMWVGKASMQNRVLMGFLTRIKEIAGDLDVTVKKEIPDMDTAKALFNRYEKEMDGIVFLRSSGAKFLGKADPSIPCFVGGCNNPKYLGAVDNLDRPEGNITGVTYFIPYDERFKIIRKLFPDMKSLALLLEKGHPGSVVDREGTKAECNRLGIEYHEVLAESADELLEKTKKPAEKVDLIILSSTAMVLDNTVSLLAITNRTSTPMFSYSEKPVRAGAVAGIVAGDVKLGRMLADSVVDVMVKGKPVSEIPVKTDPSPRILINRAMVNVLNLTIPGTILNEAELIQ